MKLFEDDPLVAPPGTTFSYSTYGWVLIGAVMESAAHQDFLDCMEAEVIAPLALHHTRPDRSGVIDPDRTAFYEVGSDGTFVAAPTRQRGSHFRDGSFPPADGKAPGGSHAKTRYRSHGAS